MTRSDAFVGALAFLAWAFILLYAKTLRVRYESSPEHDALESPKILYGFWHGRQLLLTSWYRRSGFVVMTDLSWAGEIQTRVLLRLGFVIVRGSSKRGGSRALAAVRRAVDEGRPAAFALDGPSGPVHRSKPGIIHLARALECPVVPVATSAAPAWTIPTTWCGYLLPLPFSRCIVKVGRPLWATRSGDLTTEGLDRAVAEITAAADLAVDRSPRAA
jgi:lysophospholipid acyltransferase (LPLAT)-like uncharacterized protein